MLIPNRYTHFIKETIFSHCTTSTSGGAIFIDNSNYRISILFCNFISCRADNRGGCIAVFNGAEANLKSSCLYMNAAYAAAGFIFWSDAYRMLNNSVEYTSEVSTPSYHASSFGGEIKALHSFNNMSHYSEDPVAFSKYELSGWLLLGKTSDFFFNYAELYNCTVKYLFGIYADFKGVIDKMNVISCKSDAVFKNYQSPTMLLKNTVFIESNIQFLSASDSSWITLENVFSTSAISNVETKDFIERFAIRSIECGAKANSCSYKPEGSLYFIYAAILLFVSS